MILEQKINNRKKAFYRILEMYSGTLPGLEFKKDQYFSGVDSFRVREIDMKLLKEALDKPEPELMLLAEVAIFPIIISQKTLLENHALKEHLAVLEKQLGQATEAGAKS